MVDILAVILDNTRVTREVKTEMQLTNGEAYIAADYTADGC